MPSVYIKTYGCQMNERDSDAVAAQFLNQGYTLAASEAAADVILLNTCSVRDAAEQKALGKMAALSKSLQSKRPDAILGYLGCMAQSEGEQLLRKSPGVRLVLGTQKLHRTFEHVAALREGRAQQVCDTAAEPGSESALTHHVPRAYGEPRAVTAFVSIMQGCNQHCTFCIVPTTRGRERSRPIADIVTECEILVARGVREITLLGQIVTSYGRRELPLLEDRSPFVQLLEAVNAIDGLERIRFTSPHPKGYGQDLIEAFGRLPKLCPTAHLPLQSASNAVLRRMHRGYTRERFRDIVAGLRQVCPPIGITTDLIVGFPGETEAEFAETLDFVQEIEFDNAFIFKYSPRKDTPAAAFVDQVPREVREERHARLLQQVNAIGSRRLADLVGRQLEVLVEGPSRKNPARLEGRTPCNRIVVFEGAPRHIGQLVPVRILRASSVTLYGDPAIHDPD